MAQVSIPHPPFSGMDAAMNRDIPEHPLTTQGASNLSPNETFMFPEPLNHPTSSPSHLQSPLCKNGEIYQKVSHRQRPNNISISALPPFEFGITASTPTASSDHSLNPSYSPVKLTPPSPHISGHRRGGSEFIGGDIVNGGPVLVSTNTTMSDESPPPPPSPRKGLHASRRGHAHRRSGAVSQSDVKIIMQPANEHKGSSAPSTPSEPTFHPTRPPGPERSHSQPGTMSWSDTKLGSQVDRTDSKPGPNRSRVGFSDVLEYIPRPLSTISSETSSSMSTVRAGHSTKDSITSIVSSQAASPLSLRAAGSGMKEANEEDCAPKADGLERSGTFVFGQDPFVRVVGKASSQELEVQGNIAGSEKNILAEEITDSSAQAHHFKSTSLSTQPMNHPTPSFDSLPIPRANQQLAALPPNSQFPRPRTSPEPKAMKRQHKVKSWAGSILHRKDKQLIINCDPSSCHSSLTHRDLRPGPDFSLDDVTFDNDTTHIIEEPAIRPSGPFMLQSNFSTGRLDERFQTTNIDSHNPMIDIDAALGSFSISDHDSAFDDYIGKVPHSKRRLHSSGETGGFTGPGMHYHRRAESVPSMPSFDHAKCGINRLGANNRMDEAIEEEEEDIDQDSRRRAQQDPGLGVSIVELEHDQRRPLTQVRSGHSIGENGRQRIDRASTPPNTTSPGPLEVVDIDEEPRFSVVTKSSDETTITPQLSQDPLSPHLVSTPLDSGLQTPSLTYGTTPDTPSAVSSAEYSKTSFEVRDIPRAHTASSSITDRITLNSSKAGDYGAGSTDDVPSLTSSASTMFSGHPARFSSSGNTTSSTERSASFSAAVPARTRPGSSSKRSSLASLSRLVGGSYNRSKFNSAETLPPVSPQKPVKQKRKRISRLMHFWKSREKLSAP